MEAAAMMAVGEMPFDWYCPHRTWLPRRECVECVARVVLAAVRPRWEKQLAELRSENERLLRNWDAQIAGDTKARRSLCEQSDRYLAERDAARAELERVRAAIEALAVRVENRMMATAKPAEIRAVLRPVPEQEQP